MSLAGVGIGLRPEIGADLLGAPGAVDFLEVTAETCFSNAAATREARALARVWPVVVHGVKLSLGSAAGIEPDRARKLGALSRDLGARAISEHVAFVRGGDREIGHLTGVPFTEEMARVVARNAAAARRQMPDLPFLLENAAWTFRYPDDALDEGTFHARVAERTGCDLLLDLGNVYANARNAGRDPVELLRSYPLDRVKMLHIAGGFEAHGFYFDTHAHAIPDAVFALLPLVLEVTGPIPVILERDAEFPPFAELSREIEAARAVVLAAPRARERSAAPASVGEPPGVEEATAMIVEQALLAEMLTAIDEPAPAAAAPYDVTAITRSRQILQRKRVDDALPLLPRLAQHRDAVRELAFTCVSGSARAPRLTAIGDALRIAAASLGHERLSADAGVDLLVLRSRFVGPGSDGSLRPRIGPFVSRAKVARDHVVWAVKGPGADAAVRLFESRGRA